MYTTILNGKYDISEHIKDISLEETVETIAYTAKINLVVEEWMSEGLELETGYTIEIDDEEGNVVFYGIIWDKLTDEGLGKTGALVCKERTVYLEESEDQVLFEEGTTATERNMELASKWTIPIGRFDDTGVALSKGKPQTNSIFKLMWENLKETRQKGGRMYRMRMGHEGLELVALASNKYICDITDDLTRIQQKESLEGAVTRVKVIGKQDDEKKSKIIGEYEKDTEKYGTIQKVINEDKDNTEKDTKTQAEANFNPGKRSLTVDAIDEPSIRAGDTVYIRGMELYVSNIKHQLGEPGTMRMELETEEQISQRYVE